MKDKQPLAAETVKPPQKFTLISGRTTKQGRALHRGKDSPEYLAEVSTLEMNGEDLEEMELGEGEEVHVRSPEGQVILYLRKSDELPRGVLFMPYGLPANILISADTRGTGMPSSKGIEVEIWK